MCIGYSQVVLVVKNLPANAGDTRDAGLIPGSGRSSGVRNGNPFQCSCLENRMDRGTWWTVVLVVTKSWTWLSNWAHCTIITVSCEMQRWMQKYHCIFKHNYVFWFFICPSLWYFTCPISSPLLSTRVLLDSSKWPLFKVHVSSIKLKCNRKALF